MFLLEKSGCGFMLNIGRIIRDQTKTWVEKRKKYPIAANFQARLLEARLLVVR